MLQWLLEGIVRWIWQEPLQREGVAVLLGSVVLRLGIRASALGIAEMMGTLQGCLGALGLSQLAHQCR